MSDNLYNFAEDFEPEDFDDVERRFRERESRKNHPAGTKATPPKLSDEASTYLGLAIFKFLFVTIPLALLFAGLAVVPFTGAVFGTDLGFWTAFFVLATLRWLIPRPRKQAPLEEFYAKRSR